MQLKIRNQEQSVAKLKAEKNVSLQVMIYLLYPVISNYMELS